MQDRAFPRIGSRCVERLMYIGYDAKGYLDGLNKGALCIWRKYARFTNEGVSDLMANVQHLLNI
jgi:hypothetical protein